MHNENRVLLRRRWQAASWAGLLTAVAAISLIWPARHQPVHAYIGPGAGIALLGSFLAVVSAMFAAFVTLITWPIRRIWLAIRGQKALKAAKAKRVIIVGLDGLEPTLTEQFLAEGKLPNLAKLRDMGGYHRLGTTWPPLSPVAWSSFSTGTNPGKHNIFDFITRNPNDYRPTISSVRIRESKKSFKLGKFAIPLGKPEIAQLRRSSPFWTVLGKSGIFSAIIRVPITFPPDKFRGVQLSAMCVPDLRGTQGMFSYFAEVGEAGATMDGDVGGDRIIVHRNGRGVEGYLRGPVNSLRQDRAELRLPFTVNSDGGGKATMVIGDERISLPVGGYTDWVRVSFSAAPGIKVRGVCRFMLKRFEKPFEMYCTPLQIDPDKPVMPISYPTVYSCYLARLLGPFATLGLAEDTWSLSEGLMSEDGFLEQAYGIHAEREKMLFDALDRVKQGVTVCVFDGPDRIQHMFWRFLDPTHPAVSNERRHTHAHVIPEMYRKMDELVGRVMDRLAKEGAKEQRSKGSTASIGGAFGNTVLVVMSDHGFKPFRRGVDLNAWLLKNGYLKLKGGASTANSAYLADMDWSQTKAYAIGLAGIFINLKGREAQGIVEKGEQAQKLMLELKTKLTGLRDDATGEVAIMEAMPKRMVYSGPYVDDAPDLIIGYNVGYRIAWDASIGKCGADVFADNKKAWSGDHCIHPKLVPGVLFSNVKLDGEGANIIDLAPTVLELFGVDKPDYMDGKSILPASMPVVRPPPARPQPAKAAPQPQGVAS